MRVESWSGCSNRTGHRQRSVETEARAWNAVWVVDGKIARRQLFRIEDKDDALEAAGIRR